MKFLHTALSVLAGAMLIAATPNSCSAADEPEATADAILAADEDFKPVRLPLTSAPAPYELWYGIHVDNERVGHLKQQLSVVNHNGTSMLLHRTEKTMKLQVEKRKIEVNSVIELFFDAAPPYRLSQARQEFSRSGEKKEVLLNRSGREFTVTVKSSDGESEMKPVKLDYTLENLLAAKSWIKGRPLIGEEIEVGEVDFERQKISPVRHTVVKVEPGKASDHQGYIDLAVRSEIRGELGVARMSADGTPSSFIFGKNISLVQEPAEEAQRIVYSGNLREDAQASIDRVLGDPDRIKRLVLEVHGDGAEQLSKALQNDIRWSETRNAFVLVKVSEKPKFSGTDPDEMESSLAETTSYPIRHRVIRTVATRAVAGSQSLTEAAKRLVAFVNQAIESTDVSGSLSVLDILRNRKGTCKDRARLLTSLGRSIGLPTREVTGLVYSGDQAKTFSPHTWNEVLLDGKWVSVDSTFNRFNVNPTYISFGSGEKGMTNFTRSIGQFKFKVVDVGYSS